MAPHLLGIGGVLGLVLAVAFFLLMPLWFLIAVWRIGTGLLRIASGLHGAEGRLSLTEAAELQAEAVAAFVNRPP